MNRKDLLLPLIVVFLLTFGLPLPTFHESYSKFSLQMILCGLAMAAGAAGAAHAVLRRGALPDYVRRGWTPLSLLMRLWPFRLLLLLLALSLASGLWAGSPPAWRWSALFLTTNLVWMILVYLWGKSRDGAETLLTVYLIAALAASLLGLLDYVLRIVANPDLWGEPTHRLFRPLGNPNFMAGYLITPLLLAATWALSGNADAGTPRKRAWLIGAAAVLFLTLALTGSRGGAVGLACGAFVLILLRLGRKPRLAVLGGAAALVLCAAMLAALVPGLRRWVAEESLRGTNVARSFLWTDAARMIAARPALGWGAGGFGAFHATIKVPQEYLYDYLKPSAISPHNEMLEYGVEYGLPGVVVYLAFLGTLIAAALTGPRSDPRTPAFAAALAGFIGLNVQSWLDVGLRFWDAAPFYWLLAGLLLAFAGESGGPPEREAPPLGRGKRLGVLALAGGACVAGAAWCLLSLADLAGQMNLREARRSQNLRSYRLACGEYQTALRRLVYFQDRVNAAMYLSESLQKAGLVNDAIRTLEALQSVSPNARRSNLKLGLLYMQAADQQADSDEQRTRLLEAAVGAILAYLRNNADAEGYLGLARVFMRTSPPRLDKAVSALRISLFLEPEYAAARRALVECLRGQKEERLALVEAETLAQSPRAQPADFLEQADILQGLDRKPEALEALKAGARRFPADKGILDAVKKLESPTPKM